MKRTSILLAVSLAFLAAGCASTPPGPPVPPAEIQRAIPAQVQAPPDLGDKDFEAWLTAQRSRVASERTVAHQKFAEAEMQCWQRFAVNDCLRGVRKERRTVLDGLRQEELALNQQERQRNTAARLKELQDKQRAAEPRK